MDVVYIADEQFGRLGEERLAVDVVCAGDSITEWCEDKRIGGFAAIVTRSVSED